MNQQIPRIQLSSIKEQISSSKITLVQGPKKVGKSTLVQSAIDELGLSNHWFDCNDKNVKKSLEDLNTLNESQSKIVVLKNAQYLPNLEELLELVLSGEFSFSIVPICTYKPSINEDLFEALKQSDLVVEVFAPSFYESAQHFGLTEEERLMEERLIYGCYPSVLDDTENAESLLLEYIDDIIFTRLSETDRINKGDKLLRVLRYLAFNIGEAISYNEIGDRCDLDNETVERYIKLLESAFLLIRLPSFSNDNKYELKKGNVVYFTDNGIRNALIQNFNPTYVRNDMDELWKNYVISERIKWLKMNQVSFDAYFWKTHTRQTMDYIEKEGLSIKAYKIDWSKRKKVKFASLFEKHYPEIKCGVINRSTHWKFLTEKRK